MKTFKYILFTFLLASAITACSDDDTNSRGEAEDPNCYGVYFPSQANATSHELDPAEATSLTFEAKRTKSDGEITVPIVLEGDDASAFTVTPIEFADGQETANFTVSFNNAAIGQTYTCNIHVTDKAYASIYTDKSAGLTFSVTRVKWNQVTGAGGETLASWTDQLVGPIFGESPVTGQCTVYERDDQAGVYRFTNPYNTGLVDATFGNGAYEAWGDDADVIINATNPEKVYITKQQIGVSVNRGSTTSTQYGAITIASYATEAFSSLTAAKSLYGTLVDGVFRFPVEAIAVAMANYREGAFGYFFNDNEMVILLPGAKDYDYDLSLKSGESAAGVVPISVTFGADVAKVKYAFFEGSLGNATAKTNSTSIDTDDVESAEITATGTINAQMEKTGMYTIVANIYNAAGKLQGYEYQAFGYIKSGEEVPVVATVGINITDKYAPAGNTSENSAEFYAYGEDITAAYYGVFETSKLAAGVDYAALVKANGTALTAAQLTLLNSDGFAVVVKNLVGGTNYTAVLWASNGYESAVKTTTATTNGTPHPLKVIYTADDITGGFEKAELFKSWNLWAVDYYDTKTTSRQKLSTVTFSENTTNDVTDPDDAANNQDMVNVKGLSLGAVTDDTIHWEYYNGFVYQLKQQSFGSFVYNGTTLYLGYRIADFSTSMGSAGMDYMLIGGEVADGYMAFVCYPEYADSYNFNGIFLVAYKDAALATSAGNWEAYYNIVLVDPTVDAANPMSLKTSGAGASQGTLKAIAATAAEPSNFVELRGRARMRAVIDEYVAKNKKATVNRAANVVPVEMPALGVAKAKTSFKLGVEKIAFGSAVLRANTAYKAGLE